MRKRILAVLATLFLAAAFTSPTLAAPAVPHTTNTISATTSGTERLPIPASLCNQVKAAFPARAHDPNLCTLIHGWTETTTTGKHGGLVAMSCVTGTAAFHDWITGDWETWEADLDTTFQWVGNCNYPNLIRENCTVPWTVNTTTDSPSCYSYHYYGTSGWVSTAAVFTVHVVTTIGPMTWTSWDSQRRECYSDDMNRCNWTAWVGQ